MTDAKNVRALLIEDDPDDVLFMQMFLSAFGEDAYRFELETADRLEAGLRHLAGASFDVVLLDLNLPDSTGIETFLRVIAGKPDAAVIVLTGHNDERAALEAVSLGAQDYLYKGGLSEGLLKKAILYAMERRRMVAQLEGIITAAADGMAVVDAEGVVRYLNPAAEGLFGLNAEAMLGRHFPFGLVEPGQTREAKVPAPDGTSRTVELRVAAVEWKKQAGRLVILRDIGELQKLEQLKAEVRERRKMDAMKDEFFTAVSHELRSPLTIVKAAVSNLRAGYAGQLSEKQAAILHLAHRSLKRLVRFVNNILDLSRLESGKAQPRRHPLNLALLVREAVAGYELAEERLRLEHRLPETLPQVEADPDMLAEVMGNLLDNAARFAKDRITVTAAALEPAVAGSGTRRAPAREGRGFVQVSVEDDGPGVSPEDLPVVFDRFKRSKDRPETAGVGIGLSLCKEIVEKHGGRIWAENLPGGGAAFRFTLPCV